VGQRGASQSEESQKAGKPSLLNQAAGVVKESGQPMSAKAMVEAVLAKGTWATKGKTPEATLYAAIIREIAKKGSEARFRKVERGQFALNA
jgi:restriction system protein